MHTIAHEQVLKHPEFSALLAEQTAKAVAALPAHEERIHTAAELLRAGHVLPEPGDPDGKHFLVKNSAGTVWYHTNGTCECHDFIHRKEEIQGFCKHRLASMLYRRVRAHLPPLPVVTPKEDMDPAYSLSRDDVVEIQGKAHITYKGLLAMAHGAGLKRLSARFVSVTDELAIAEASAEFEDGRIFEEAGDSTPSNVAFRVRPHFARMALTRAKARCLRDALCITTCAYEELAE